MVTRAEARRIADEFINRPYNVEGDLLEILDSLTMERAYGWIFFYDSTRHIYTGDPRHMLAGNGPVLVEKDGGRVIQFGSARPPEYYIAEYEQARNEGTLFPFEKSDRRRV